MKNVNKSYLYDPEKAILEDEKREEELNEVVF